MAIELYGCENTGYRHTGADRTREISLPHDIGLAALDVRCDSTKWNWQIIKIRQVRDVNCQLSQDQIQLLPLNYALRQQQRSVTQANFEVNRILRIVLFAAKTHIFACGHVCKCVGPVQRRHQLFKFIRSHARCIQAANDRAHTCTCNRINRYAISLELFQYANVRRSTSPATAQHQADLRPVSHFSGNSVCTLTPRHRLAQ